MGLRCPDERKIILGRDIIFDEARYSLDEDFYKTILMEDQGKNPKGPSTEINQIQNENETSSSSEGREVYESADEEESDQDANLKISKSNDLQETATPRRSTRVKTRPNYLVDYIGIALSAEAFVDDIPQDYNNIQ